MLIMGKSWPSLTAAEPLSTNVDACAVWMLKLAWRGTTHMALALWVLWDSAQVILLATTAVLRCLLHISNLRS